MKRIALHKRYGMKQKQKRILHTLGQEHNNKNTIYMHFQIQVKIKRTFADIYHSSRHKLFKSWVENTSQL